MLNSFHKIEKRISHYIPIAYYVVYTLGLAIMIIQILCKTQADSVVSDTNGLLTSCLRSMATRGERHNSYYADHTMLTIPNARRILWCLGSQFISAGRDPRNRRRNGRKLNSMSQWSNLNWLFFKIFKFSGPSLPGMTPSTL